MGPGIADLELKTPGRLLAIEWQIGCRGLQDCELRGNHLYAALDADGHPRLSLYSQFPQAVRPLIRKLVEFLVAQPLVLVSHCKRLRMERCMSFNHLDN